MRILVVKLSSIGDVVHTLPAVASIRRRHPCARISWVVDARASAILKDSPVIDELIEVDPSRWRNGLFERQTVKEAQSRLRQLRGSLVHSGPDSGVSRNGPAARPDIAIDFQGLVKSGLIALLSGATRRIGFESYDLREKASRYLLTDQVHTARAVHVIDKNIELAESISFEESVTSEARNGGPRPRYEFPITVSSEDERYIDETLSGADRVAILN